MADLEIHEAITLSPFPPTDGWPALEDEPLRKTFADLQVATRGIREARSRYNVVPKELVDVTIKVSVERAESLRRQSHIIERSARVRSLVIDPTAKRAKNAATIVVGGLEIFVADIADDQADRKRLANELENIDKQIRGKKAKLSNENFTNRAPAEVVQREQERLAELQAKHSVVQSHLTSLSE